MDVGPLPLENWKAYRDLRLRALREDSEAFSSSLAASENLPDEFWKKRLADAWLAERSWLLFAREDDRLVGMIGAFVEQGSADTATVVSVYVPKEERGKGIAARLMGEMLRVLSERPVLKRARLSVNVSQLPAADLYRRFGFREIGREPSRTGAGQPVEQIVMELPLARRPGADASAQLP
jgi:ribosomal protein S18 acetylase RimI-like enzyme